MNPPPGYVVIGGRYHPQANWSRCTRIVAYEPGVDTWSGLPEREGGRFTFEATAMAAVLVETYKPEVLELDDFAPSLFSRWYGHADLLDDRITRLPGRLGWIDRELVKLIRSGGCRVHCRSCARGVLPETLLFEDRVEAGPYRFGTVRCLEGHLLMRVGIIRLLLAPRRPRIQYDPANHPGSRE